MLQFMSQETSFIINSPLLLLLRPGHFVHSPSLFISLSQFVLLVKFSRVKGLNRDPVSFVPISLKVLFERCLK